MKTDSYLLLQVTERLFELGFTVYVASVLCSATSKDEIAGLDPRLNMLACGSQFTT